MEAKVQMVYMRDGAMIRTATDRRGKRQICFEPSGTATVTMSDSTGNEIARETIPAWIMDLGEEGLLWKPESIH